MSDSKTTRAEDIAHVLRDSLALLPGSRDRQGRPVLFFPSKEQTFNAEDIRKVLLYLHSVTADDARERGFVIIIDMRGKQTWNNVKAILKGINHLSSLASIHIVLIIKPDKFWEKQKAQISLGSWDFEVQMIGADNIVKFVDLQQIPAILGGSLPYDHDDWLEIRTDLEKWIWHISDIMRGLESNRHAITGSAQPTDVASAQGALSQHKNMKQHILSIPGDLIQQEGNKIMARINQPSRGSPNPDLISVLPHMTNLVTSCLDLKNKVFHEWEKRNSELGNMYCLKLFENDVEELHKLLRCSTQLLLQTMSDIGSNEPESADRLRQFDDFERSVKNSEVNYTSVIDSANRLKNSSSTPQHRTRIDRSVIQVKDEWERLQNLLRRRRVVLTAAVAFFRCSNQYLANLPEWLKHPGVNPDNVKSNDTEMLDEAIRAHEEFFSQAEGIFLEACDHGSRLAQILRECEAEDTQVSAREHLMRAHRQLRAAWEKRKMRLASMLALIAFRTDTQRVIEWLEEHGNTYLSKNTKIGDSEETAKMLYRNHTQFRRIAQNTFSNATKLFQARDAILSSGIKFAEDLEQMMSQLDYGLKRFTKKLEARHNLLNLSMVFHTHYKEMMKWFGEMEMKYDGRVCVEVEDCEHAKEMWILESDGTVVAYDRVMGEGNKLVEELRNYQALLEVDYSNAIEHVSKLLSDIDQNNQRLTNRWSAQRTLLQISLVFANFYRDSGEVLMQIKNWEEDMKGMLASPTFLENAEKVSPYHKDNTHRVKEAIKNTKKSGQELIQIIRSHHVEELQTRNGEHVIGLIQSRQADMEMAEKGVLRVAAETAARIDGVSKYNEVRCLARKLQNTYEDEEKRMSAMGGIPRNYDEAVAAMQAHEEFRQRVAELELDKNKASLEYFSLIRSLVTDGIVDRNALLDLNEVVVTRYRRLVGLTDERQKLLRSAVGCYKTYYTAVIPILDQLERDSKQINEQDYCRQCTSSSTQERTNYIAELISKHMDYKDRLLKGCTYAQKTSETFLKYIQRANVSQRERNMHEQKINSMKSAQRERQSKILEVWSKKKKHLDRCQQYVLLDASREQIVGWLEGEGEAKLSLFLRHCRNMAPEQASSILEDFSTFKIKVKEKRANIKELVLAASKMEKDDDGHRRDIRDCVDEVKVKFELFSKRVTDCEASLRGGRPLSSNEFSLDRHSDASVEENLEKEREAVVNEQIKKMREPMQELIKSERDYVEDLRRCVMIYLKEFDAASPQQIPAVLRDKRKDIFGNVEKIYAFHSERFVNELIKYENDPEDVGCSFTVWVDYLNELYTDYCVNKEQNNYLIALPEANQFFSVIREKHGLEMNSDLCSLLIKPVQRITRYRLMMEQLLKNCTANLDELREAYEVVLSVPRRVNDIIHLNCLDREKLVLGDSLGVFVMQDSLTVWEPRSYFKKGKERQVFLFEMAIVFAKKLEMPSKNLRYLTKGRPVFLSEVSVVEHLEGDVCRFGLRVGTVSTNDNRTDLKASSENAKIMWVKKIRELTQGLLSIGTVDGGVSVNSISNSSQTSSSARSMRSNISSSSGDRLSRDAEALSVDCHRFSIHSTDSSELANADQWVISSDFDAIAEGQLSVRRGEKVEILEQQPSDVADWVQVVIVDDPSRAGLLPTSILLPDQPSSSTDRPEANSGSIVKRKSLKRIFTNSTKEHKASVSSPTTPTAIGSVQDHSTYPVLSSGATSSNAPVSLPSPVEVPVIVSDSAGAQNSTEDEPLEGLPPPMEELSLNNTSSHINDDSVEAGSSQEADGSPSKPEESAEDLARKKRQYVLMELVETEQDYVRDLTSVVEGYIANLEQMELPAELQGKDKIIFANISQILDFHRDNFSKEIEKCLDNYDAAGCAFVKYERRLHHLYVKYCQNKPKSDYLVSQDEFEVFFAETKLKLGHKVALCDLLIKPVQRIMKYQLLLKDILKYTERAGDSTVQLKKALQVMHVVPKACDDMMQVGRLQNFDGQITAQGPLLHQGTLSIAEASGSNIQKAKDRRIFLFEQSAIIADHIPPKKEFGNPQYIFKSIIMINKMQFQKNPGYDDPLKFSLGSTDPTQPNFICTAQSQEEKNEWVRVFEDKLDQQKRILEQLMNPKKYMGGGDDLSAGLGGLSLSSDKKPAAPTRGPVPPSKAAAGKVESPKRESKSKLFGFGKKSSAKSPTSPPP